MKRIVSLGILLLLATTATVNADMRTDRLKLFEFDFTCHFQKHGPTPPALDAQSPNECTAYATVFAYVDTHDWMTTMRNPRQNLINKIAVRCGTQLVEADSAILQSERRFVAITGISGTPKLLVERRHHESVTTMDNDYDAFLLFDNQRLRGECEVVNRPVFGHHPAE